VTSILIGRSAPSELGVYYIAMSIVLFVKGIQHQMIAIPYTIYQHQRSGSDSEKYRGSCLTQHFGLMILALVIMIAQTIALCFGYGSSEIIPSLIVLLALIPVLMLRELARHYCFTHQKNVGALVIDSSISLLQIGAMVCLGYLGFLSGASAWAVIGLCSLVVVGVWFQQRGPKVQFQKQSIRDDWKQNWSFGKWAVGGQLVGSLPVFLLPWIIAAATSTKDTGYFAAAMTLIGLANIFNSGMSNYLTPKAAKVFVEEGVHALRTMLFQIAIFFVVVLGAFVIVISGLGGWIASAIYKFDGLHTIMIILAVAKLFDSLTIVASNGLFVLEKIKANFYIDVCLLVVTLTTAVLLVIPYGILGAAWTTLVASSFSASMRTVAVIYFLQQRSKIEGVSP